MNGYTVVYGSGGSGSQIVPGYGVAYISGGSGSDVLCAWGGSNTLDGGAGHDALIVMSGFGNTLLGGSGSDTMNGIAGDVFNGGSGHNQVIQNEPVRTATHTFNQRCNAVLNVTGFQPGTYVVNFIPRLQDDVPLVVGQSGTGTAIFADGRVDHTYNSWVGEVSAYIDGYVAANATPNCAGSHCLTNHQALCWRVDTTCHATGHDHPIYLPCLCTQ